MKKLWPSRTKAEKSVEPIADLDAIIADPIPFRFKGKIHKLKPVSMEEFLKFTNANSRLQASIHSTEPLTAQALAEQYHSVISAVCDTITIEDINSMEQAQIAALYQLVIDMITGQVDLGAGTEDGKKKRKKLDIYDSAQASFSPSAPQNSDGLAKKH